MINSVIRRSVVSVASALLCLLSLSVRSDAQAPNVTYSAPINVTKGGIITGNFKSTDSGVPCIRIQTTEPVTIENCILAGAGNLIEASGNNGSFGGATLIVRNNRGYGLTQSADNTTRARFLNTSSAKSLLVEHNYLEQTTGIVIYQWGGNGTAQQTLTVRYNQVRNIDGRFRNPSTSFEQTSNFIGMNQVHGLVGAEIAWNQVINEPNNSLVEDNINFYDSGGTVSSPVQLHDNYIFGSYPYPATGGNHAGTGFISDGSSVGGSQYIQGHHNQVLSTGNAAINIAAGHHINFYQNRIVNSGLLPDGTRLNMNWAGGAIWNCYNQSSFGNNTMVSNTVGFVAWGGNYPYADRRDYDPNFMSGITDSIHLPNPITLQTEANEWTLWQQKLAQNGITVGPGGSTPQNTPPTVSVTSPANGATFTAPASVTINATASDSDGSVTKVEFFQGTTKLGEDTTSPYSFAWTSVAAGSYTLTAKATDNSGALTTSAGIGITVGTGVPPPGGSGSISREVWTGVSGNSVADIPVTTTPSISDTLTSLEGPTDWADSYGTRIRGYITAPYTGSYTFWIASDDNSQLWLSSNDQPANKVLIASVSSWTPSRAWGTMASQKSAAINLTAGQKYYVEVLQKEGAGGDNVAVGWAKPGQSTTAPSEVIPGAQLSPWVAAPVLPEGFSVVNFGGASGAASHSSSVFTITSDGLNIWDAADDATFVKKSVSGANVTVTATLQSIGNTSSDAAVGIMIRESDAANSRHYNVRMLPSGFIPIVFRSVTGGTSAYEPGPSLTFPVTVKIEKTGNVYQAYYQSGSTWIQMGTAQTIAMGDSVQVGVTVQANVLTRATTTGSVANFAVAASTPPPPIPVPAVPAGLSAVAGNSQVALSWTAASGAASYNVKRATTSGGPYTTLTSPTTTSYTDTSAVNGTAYYYVVSAVNSSGESANSSQVSATPQNVLPTVSVTSPVNGATFTSPATVTINATAADQDGTVAKVEFYQGTTKLGEDTTSPYSFSWTSVAAGSYTLTAKATDNNGGLTTSAGIGVTVSIPVPAVPAGLSAVAGNAQVALSWNSASGAASYNVKRATTSGGPYTALASPTATSYTDASAVNGTTYYYVVSAVNASGESANSSQVSAQPLSSQGTYGNNGNPWAISSTATVRIEAENYDVGGEGVAYHDADVANNGGQYRTSEGVDVEASGDAGAGYNVGWTATGEWLEYTINVPAAGNYNLKLRTARTGNGSVRVLFNGVDKTGAIALPVTGGWQTYADVTVAVSLSAGVQVMRIEMLSDGFNINWIELSPTLPSPWASSDIGAVGVVGSASYAGGTFTIKGSGANIWGTADAFQYVYQSASGDCEMKAKVTSIQNTDANAKAGVMIRESLNANSAYVLMCRHPDGLIFQYRTATGGTCSYSWGGNTTSPYWVRVTRTANVFKGYISTDGTTWTQVGSNVTIAMGSSTYLGMGVCSLANTTLNTSTFSNVTAVP